VWVSFIIPGLGALRMGIGLASMVLDIAKAWNAMIVGLLALPEGAIVFGAVAYRTGALSRGGSALLAVGVALQLRWARTRSVVIVPAGSSPTPA
jgi:hypothetical protein